MLSKAFNKIKGALKTGKNENTQQIMPDNVKLKEQVILPKKVAPVSNPTRVMAKASNTKQASMILPQQPRQNNVVPFAQSGAKVASAKTPGVIKPMAKAVVPPRAKATTKAVSAKELLMPTGVSIPNNLKKESMSSIILPTQQTSTQAVIMPVKKQAGVVVKQIDPVKNTTFAIDVSGLFNKKFVNVVTPSAQKH